MLSPSYSDLLCQSPSRDLADVLDEIATVLAYSVLVYLDALGAYMLYALTYLSFLRDLLVVANLELLVALVASVLAHLASHEYWVNYELALIFLA